MPVAPSKAHHSHPIWKQHDTKRFITDSWLSHCRWELVLRSVFIPESSSTLPSKLLSAFYFFKGIHSSSSIPGCPPAHSPVFPRSHHSLPLCLMQLVQLHGHTSIFNLDVKGLCMHVISVQVSTHVNSKHTGKTTNKQNEDRKTLECWPCESTLEGFFIIDQCSSPCQHLSNMLI